MADDPRKSELIAELEQYRHQVAANVHGLRTRRERKEPSPQRLRRYRPWALGGAGLIGLLLAKLPPRRGTKVIVKGRKDATEKKVVRGSLILMAAKIALDLFRPMLTRWVTQRVLGYAATRVGR
jgi:hypothetical protein